jgi:hypothetical protein
MAGTSAAAFVTPFTKMVCRRTPFAEWQIISFGPAAKRRINDNDD